MPHDRDDGAAGGGPPQPTTVGFPHADPTAVHLISRLDKDVVDFLLRLDKTDVQALHRVVRIVQEGTDFAKVMLFLLGLLVAAWSGLDALGKLLKFKGF